MCRGVLLRGAHRAFGIDRRAIWRDTGFDMENSAQQYVAPSKDLEHFLELWRRGGPGQNGYVALLGLDVFELPALLREVRKGLPYRAFEKFSRSLSAPAERVLSLTAISRRTLARRKAEGRFSPEESDRLLRAARIFARALELFEGDRLAALDWLSEPQTALGGAIPFELAQSEVGAREIEAVAYRLEHGIYS
jgi:putative toxin-antitoxin system antitoxin component (TIGR02293 family)